MQSGGNNALVERMVGAARLDVHTYEAVERDESATTSALIVVVLSAIASGIGSIGDEGFGGLIGGVIGSIVGWAVFAAVAFFVGTRILAGSQTSATIGQVLRTMGFAYTPLLLSFFGFIPILGGLIGLIAAFWFLATATVGLRQALDVSTGRAVGVALVSVIPAAIIAGIILTIFGIGR